jgi:tRNA-dihydrouridine synthase B
MQQIFSRVWYKTDRVCPAFFSHFSFFSFFSHVLHLRVHRDIFFPMDKNITDILFNGKAHLAPMLGTTDIPFRSICRQFDAGLVFTEMVSTKGLLNSRSESFQHATFDPSERPVAIQLAVSTPEAAALSVCELLPHRPTLFDINCGCPDGDICGAGAGASLLDDLPRLEAVIGAAARASKIPVSAKIRASGKRGRHDVRDLARAVENAGAAFVTVHGRTANTPYGEPASWEPIARAKASVGIPVIGNGDVYSSADAVAMRRDTGCDAVMIGRGSLGTPWIFRDVALGRDCGIHDFAPSGEELLRLVVSHLKSIEREFGPVNSVSRMRKHAIWYLRYHEGSDDLRERLFRQETPALVSECVERFMAGNPARFDPDEERFREREKLFRKRILYWIDGVWSGS